MTRFRFKYASVLILLLLALPVFSACHPLEPSSEGTTEKTMPEDDTKHNAAYFLRLDIGQIKTSEEESENYHISEHRAVIGPEEIDAKIEEEIAGIIQNFKKLNADFRAKDKSYRAELKLTTATFAIDQNRFTYLIQSFILNGGEAHGINQYKILYFDRKNKRQLKLDALLKAPYLEALAKSSDAFFRQSESYRNQVDTDIYKKGISADVKNYQHVIVTAEAVEVIFLRYQLFSGNYGEPTISFAYGPETGLQLLRAEASEPSPSPTPRETTIQESTAQVSTFPEKTETESTQTVSIPNSNEKLIALTFDDGPYAPVDETILEAAARVNGKVTFFFVGNRISSYPDNVRAILNAGHEIGNHSHSHPELCDLSLTDIQNEFKEMDLAIEKLGGPLPKLIRPTYGIYNEAVQEAAERPLVNWSVDTMDWQSRSADLVYRAIMDGASDGAIILMHDIYPSTADAVARAIPELDKQGYRLVTVSELLALRMPDAKKGQVINACPAK